MTGYSTFVQEGVGFNQPTIVINDQPIDFPYAEYIVDDANFSITHVGLSAEDLAVQLENAKLKKKDEISKAFDIEEKQPVVVGNITYFGGVESATKLDSAKRLSELVGATTVTFFDVNNLPNTLTIAEAEAVIIAIAVKYQNDFAKKQGLYSLITSTTTLGTLDTIVW